MAGADCSRDSPAALPPSLASKPVCALSTAPGSFLTRGRGTHSVPRCCPGSSIHAYIPAPPAKLPSNSQPPQYITPQPPGNSPRDGHVDAADEDERPQYDEREAESADACLLGSKQGKHEHVNCLRATVSPLFRPGSLSKFATPCHAPEAGNSESSQQARAHFESPPPFHS